MRRSSDVSSRRIAAACGLRAAGIARRRRRPSACRRRRGRADAGAWRRGSAHDRHAPQKHRRGGTRQDRWRLNDAARRADRRHRDRQVVLPRAIRRARRRRWSTRTCSPVKPSPRVSGAAPRRSAAASARRSFPPTAPSTGPRSAASSFSDRAARADLEAIVHPAVYRRISEWFITLPPDTRVAIADIPLLFETGHGPDFDRVVVCACEPAEQMRRLMVRDRLSEPRRARVWMRSGRSRRRSRGPTTSSGRTEPWPTPRPRVRTCTKAKAEKVPRERRLRVQCTRGARACHGDRFRLRAESCTSASSSASASLRCPSLARFALRRTYPTRGSAGTARGARCCGTGSGCRCAGRGRKWHRG